jgi:formylmethanofuran dehydrogenase subunit C
MSLTLTWRSANSLPVDGATISPAAFEGLSSVGASRLRLGLGNTRIELGELFDVAGDKGDDRLIVAGDLMHVHGLGRGMAAGALLVRGEAGPQLGAEMTGGVIDVDGNVGDWAGAEMRGGRITIRGNTGSFLGAAYPGSRLGMRDGVILIEGSTGHDAGLQMRRGLIAIRVAAGAGLGRAMIAGTIIALGPIGTRFGAGMKRGTLVLPDPGRAADDVVLPSFAPAGRFRSPILALYYQQLAEWGFTVPRAVSSALIDRYNGDLAAGGQGEILVGSHAG